MNGNPLSIVNSRSPNGGSASYDIMNDENFIASARVDEQDPLVVARIKKLSNVASNMVVLSPLIPASRHPSNDSSDDGDSDGGAKEKSRSGKGLLAQGNDVRRTRAEGKPTLTYYSKK